MNNMELKKVDAGIWVKASEGEPTIGDYYYCKVDTKQDCIVSTIVEWAEHKNGDYKYQDWDFDSIEHFNGFREDAEIIEWLKPIEQVYVLTEEEMEDLKHQAYSKGYELGKKYGDVPF